MIVACPTCYKTVAFDAASPWRPFCSQRCRLIDLGEWICEEKRIPGPCADMADAEVLVTSLQDRAKDP